MIEEIILSSLVFNEDYIRKVLPYLRKDYFKQLGHQVAHKLIKDHYTRYHALPSIDSLKVDLEQSALAETVYDQTRAVIERLKPQSTLDYQWLLDTSEQFCKRQALFNAIARSATLLEKPETTGYGLALDLVQDALSVSFNDSIGHDYLEDAAMRHAFYQTREDHLPCDLAEFNEVTQGGFANKTLTVFIAPTGAGKSLFLCHFATAFIEEGKNVLYISLEMSVEKVGERIDAHLMDVAVNDLKNLEVNGFMNRVSKLKQRGLGKLIIEQFPGKSSHSGHFRHLLNDLKLKKGFKPDVVIVDYLGICGSAISGPNTNSYEYQKNVAEELRGLAVENNCRMFTAVQVNREGSKSNDFDMTDTADSWGVPATADYMYGIIVTDELTALNQIKIKRLKDRYMDFVSYKPSFIVGVDRPKMRLYDVEEEVALNKSTRSKESKSDRNTKSDDILSKFQSLVT